MTSRPLSQRATLLNPAEKGALGPQVGSVRAAADKPGLYFADHLRRWRAKYSQAHLAQAVIGVYGHSVVAGAYADNGSGGNALWRTQGFVGDLRRRFAQQFGDPGEGYFWINGETYAGIIGTMQNGASVTGGNSTGYAGYRITLPSPTSSFTIAAPQSTTIRLHFIGQFQPATYTVDGGAVQTCPTSNNDTYFVDITGLADTTHTVVVNGPATGAAYFLGVEFRRQTATGVRVHRFGYSGMCIADCFAWATPAGNPLGDLSDANKDRQLRTCVGDLGVDLAVLMYNVNDTSRGFGTYGWGVADVQNAVQTVCNKFVAAGVDVLLLCGPPKDPSQVPAGSPSVAAFAQAYYNVAAATDRVSFLDIERIWPAWNQTKNVEGLSYDYVHANTKGHADIGRILYQALGT